MSEVTRRTISIRRHEYAVPSGTAYVELQKAISLALTDLPEDRQRYDDACYVEARDGEVVVFWAEKVTEP